MGHTRVEICANGLESALTAQKGGADRIELCRSLELDGLTPNPRTIRAVIEKLQIPVHLLIRPRDGDFIYTDKEIKTIIGQIAMAQDTGCAGVVCGALNSKNEIDLEVTRKLLQAAGNLHFTFHRAFDQISDQASALEQLIDLGVKRVLTSGGELSALKGIKSLSRLLKQANGRIEIMPGAGINSSNVNQFLEAGFKSIHLSASLNKGSGQSGSPRTQLAEVRAVVEKVRAFNSTLKKG